MKIEIKAETEAEIKKLFSSFDNHMQENFRRLFKVMEIDDIVRVDIVLHDKYETPKIDTYCKISVNELI